MSKVISISPDIYPIDDVLKDLTEVKNEIKDLAFITILKDGTAYVSHTGLNYMHMALACKLLDVEFNNLVRLAEEMEEE